MDTFNDDEIEELNEIYLQQGYARATFEIMSILEKNLGVVNKTTIDVRKLTNATLTKLQKERKETTLIDTLCSRIDKSILPIKFQPENKVLFYDNENKTIGNLTNLEAIQLQIYIKENNIQGITYKTEGVICGFTSDGEFITYPKEYNQTQLYFAKLFELRKNERNKNL